MDIVLWRVLHILFVAAWFGMSVSIGADAKRAINNADSKGGELMIERASKNFGMSFAAMLLTFGSGLALLFAKGGFSAVNPKIHMGLGMTLIAIVFRGALAIPAFGKIKKGVAAGGSDAEEAKKKTGLLSMALGIEHLLWLVTLLLMLYAVYGPQEAS